ncbi:hypothetical protein VP1G_06975 [Cytospora mali]|uniref:Uncharacterized protein n=1 Tax=Cytospora mali TaxID=578113 RepID=A0A194V740_CYTMA|nr:hypothetical protein VP1G_06975 [Valsa mali var. pyri (nom. inval.)]
MHHFFRAILLFFAAMALPSVLADDILFFSSLTACNRNTDWVYCSDVGPEHCCHAKSPFCGRISCNYCEGDTLAVFRGQSTCPGLSKADSTCTPTSGLYCCMDAGRGSVCAGAYYDSTSKRRSEYLGLSDPPSNSTCRTPDGMVYHDPAGVRREIKNMTTEMYENAMDLYGRGDLGALNGTVLNDKDAFGATDKA